MGTFDTDFASVTDMQKYFTGIQKPCPSNLCDGFLTEYDQETWDPFKAFLVCPKCESRLRLVKKEN